MSLAKVTQVKGLALAVPGDDASEAAWFDEDGLEDDGEVVRGVVAFLRRHRR